MAGRGLTHPLSSVRTPTPSLPPPEPQIEMTIWAKVAPAWLKNLDSEKVIKSDAIDEVLKTRGRQKKGDPEAGKGNAEESKKMSSKENWRVMLRAVKPYNLQRSQERNPSFRFLPIKKNQDVEIILYDYEKRIGFVGWSFG